MDTDERRRKPKRKLKVRRQAPQTQSADLMTLAFWKEIDTRPGFEIVHGSFFERLRISNRAVQTGFKPGDRLVDFRDDWTCRCSELTFSLGGRESTLCVLDECCDEDGDPWDGGAMCHTSLNGKELAYTNWYIPRDTVHIVHWNPGPSKANFEDLFKTTCLSEDDARNYEHVDQAVTLLFFFLYIYLRADQEYRTSGGSVLMKLSMPMCIMASWPNVNDVVGELKHRLLGLMLKKAGILDEVRSKLAYTEELSIAEIKECPLGDESMEFLVVKPEYSLLEPDMWTWPLLAGFMEIVNESQEPIKLLGLPADGKKHFVRPTSKPEIVLSLLEAASATKDDTMHLDEVRVQVENIETGQVSQCSPPTRAVSGTGKDGSVLPVPGGLFVKVKEEKAAVQEDLEDAQEGLGYQVLTTNALHTKIDQLAALALANGADPSAVSAIKNRSNAA